MLIDQVIRKKTYVRKSHLGCPECKRVMRMWREYPGWKSGIVLYGNAPCRSKFKDPRRQGDISWQDNIDRVVNRIHDTNRLSLRQAVVFTEEQLRQIRECKS